MPPRISKNDISHPTPLLSPQQAQAASQMHDLHPPTDSGIHLANPSNGNNNSHPNSPTHPLPPSIPPFSAGRFDSSASVAGGPNDPKILRRNLPPPRLTLRQYQSFVQALAVYRRQVLAMARAGETFARALEELADFVPAAQIRRPHVVGDLDFLIDSTHLVSNAHQIYAESLERDFELPLVDSLKEIETRTRITRVENKSKVLELVERLDREEKSNGLGKKGKRDMAVIQSSLNVRMSLADEIKRLTVENQTIHDSLSHASMSYILESCASGVRAELQTYETVHEGLKKLGAYSDSSSSPPGEWQHGQHHPHQHAGTHGRRTSTRRASQQPDGGGSASYDHRHQQQQYGEDRERQEREAFQERQERQQVLSRVLEGDEGTWDGDENAFDMEFVRNALKNLAE
ncbi:hypothetical protein HKX48_001569 [Thoreauomyces humboldtii]|nr:hypothetical protein HKX48_001569 [Thoreauomyces humboldtii]